MAAVRARSSQNLLARLGRDRDEALAAARVGEAHDFRGRARDLVLVVADDVADQHHLRPPAAARLGGVADRLEVALVQVLEARQDRARVRVQVVP